MRTAIDLAATGPLAAGLMALDHELRHQLLQRTSAGALRRMALAECEEFAYERLSMADAVRWTKQESRRLTAAIAHCNPLRESPGESASYAAMVLGSLPLPQCQVPVVTRLGTVYPDFLWEAERVVGECDGLIKYRDTDHDTLVREKLRQEALELAGWRVVRWTGTEVIRTPELVVTRITRALNSR